MIFEGPGKMTTEPAHILYIDDIYAVKI